MTERTYQTFHISEVKIFKQKMLDWINQFSISCFLDNNEYASLHSNSEWIIGVAETEEHSYVLDPVHCFQQVQMLQEHFQDWFLGHFNFEAFQSASKNHPVPFPVSHFFRPDHLLILKNQELQIGSILLSPDEIYQQIIQFKTSPKKQQTKKSASILCIDTPDSFIQKIQHIQHHIQRGDCYEMNYCTAFYAEGVKIEPIRFYEDLTKANPSPFAAYYRYFDQYLISASPERFLQKVGDILRSQPIKGTIQRLTDPELDQKQQLKLNQSSKDQAENVMIVDLVRNDLSMIAEPGSVEVEELMKLYSFPFVHQLITTIKAKLADPKNWGNAIEACYPMGSMTGAPKKKVIELTQKLESQPRGIFSGSIGYITPTGDFDFNVVIRSVLYNAKTQYICFPAGAGITIYSNAAEEWQECLLKIENIKKMLAS